MPKLLTKKYKTKISNHTISAPEMSENAVHDFLALRVTTTLKTELVSQERVRKPIRELMEMVDQIKDEGGVNENTYLKLANTCKEAFDVVSTIHDMAATSSKLNSLNDTLRRMKDQKIAEQRRTIDNLQRCHQRNKELLVSVNERLRAVCEKQPKRRRKEVEQCDQVEDSDDECSVRPDRYNCKPSPPFF